MKPHVIMTKNGWRLEQTSLGDVIISRRLPGQLISNSVHCHSQNSKSAVDHDLLALNRKTFSERGFRICLKAILKFVKPWTRSVVMERGKLKQRVL